MEGEGFTHPRTRLQPPRVDVKYRMAALTLRAVYLRERLPTLWPHFSADYSADVQAAA